LLYLASAFDVRGRRYASLIDSTRDPLEFCRSLAASDATARAAVDDPSDALGLS
jgi:hypothetical protein